MRIEYNEKQKGKILKMNGVQSQKWLDDEDKKSLKYHCSRNNEPPERNIEDDKLIRQISYIRRTTLLCSR